MAKDNKILGKQGEDAAAEYLRAAGYELRARNFYAPVGELDIVAQREGVIVFVEVKTRRSLSCGSPAQSVNFRKQQKIIQTARWYLRQFGLDDFPCRFDVAEVYALPGKSLTVSLIEGAFEA